MAADLQLRVFPANIRQVFGPGHQILQIRRIGVVDVLHHDRKQMLQIFVWLQLICLCRFNNAVNDGAGVCPFEGINHVPVGSSNREWANGSLAGRIINRDISVLQKDLEIFFLIDAVPQTVLRFLAHHGIRIDLLYPREVPPPEALYAPDGG